MAKRFSLFIRKHELMVSDAMNSNPTTISPASSITDASKKMISTDKGSLLVVENGMLQGIITKTDILHSFVSESSLKTKVSDVMTKGFLSVSPKTSLSNAAKIMVDYGIRRLPVLEKGELKGIITQTDMLRIQPAILDLLTEKFVQQKSVSDVRSLKGVKGVCDVCGEIDYLERNSSGFVCNNCAEALQ